MRVITIVGLIITGVFFQTAWAQNNSCEDQLKAAAEEFAAGRFYGIPGMLKPCLDKGFSREQRQRAYMLLTQTYLLLEDPLAAETSYMEILRANPEFRTDPSRDPIEVVYLSKKFTADPIFSWHAKAGASAAVVRVIHDVDLVSSVEGTREKYRLRPTIHLQAGADWHFYDRFSLSSGIKYAALSFTFEESDKYGRDLEEMTERQSWLSVPVSVRFSSDKGKFRPYGFLGLSADILLSDRAQFNIYNTEPDGISKDAESPSINFMPKRNVLNYSGFIGGGVRLKYGLDFFFAEASYAFGLTNVVDAKAIYSANGSGTNRDVFPYGHVDNYFRVDNLSISIGYLHPLYKPRKLKQARTKGLLRSIKKESK
jgi:hypothetical protein